MVEGEGEILMESKLYVFKKAYLIHEQSIYEAVLISAVQQHESFIDVYAFFFHILFHWWLITGSWISLLDCYMGTVLWIHPVWDSWRVLIPNSQVTDAWWQQPVCSFSVNSQLWDEHNTSSSKEWGNCVSLTSISQWGQHFTGHFCPRK